MVSRGNRLDTSGSWQKDSAGREEQGKFPITDAPDPDPSDYPRYSASEPLPTQGSAAHGYAYRSRKTSWKMFALLVALAVLVGLVIALILPRVSGQIATSTGANNPTGEAANVLQSLTVRNSGSSSGYDRYLFGFRQTDDDGNGCDIREDVLARDMTSVRYKRGSSCQVYTGVLVDPYTGKTIHFLRGVTTSALVQIDHVVALHNAWNSGASSWSTAKRYQFANDPYNLLAVDGNANQDKGDASADEWLPSNKRYRCSYVARQIAVKKKYSLTVTESEKTAMMTTLSSCPAQKLP